MTRQLLEDGVPIGEINAVRKHLSEIKGGQVAREAAPASVVGLIMSDVVGNDLSTIGSGPMVPDSTTFTDALAVFNRHDLGPPAPVRDHLDAGIAGQMKETPFPDDPVFDQVKNHLLANNGVALDPVKSVAEDVGYRPMILTTHLRGEATEVAKPVVGVSEEIAATGNPLEPPAVLLAGGECTVTLSDSNGNGGPNQEFVLSAGLELTREAVDTDGEDGSSDVAGAIVDFETVSDPARAQSCLDQNDAGAYLSDVNARIRTDPTGTNVNDVVVVVIPSECTQEHPEPNCVR